MDEKRNDSNPVSEPATDVDDGGPARSVSADRLVSRLAELRAQVEVLAPPDQDRGREAIERIRQAQERVTTLELMLARAREREDSLTIQTVRDQAAIADGEARIAELGAIAARAAEGEAARREREAAAAEDRRKLTLAQTEAEARRAEIVRLRSRCSELETDLSGLARELAAAAVARAEASRTERERDEARDRAYAERRLAAEDRQRAAEANMRATELQSQLRAAERRIVQLTNQQSLPDAEPETPPKVLEATRTEAPWTELQRASSAAAGPRASATQTIPAAAPGPIRADAMSRDAADDADVIDLTEEPSPVERASANGTTAWPEEAATAVGEPHTKTRGFLHRVLRGRHHDPGSDRSQPA